MSRPTELIIDIDALRHNLQQVKKNAPAARIMAMVKANAYGHGLVSIAKGLNQADALAVACLEEAMLLREAGIQQDIILIEGLFHAAELEAAIKHRLTLVLHHETQIDLLTHAPSTDKKILIWLKINTGMNRLGFPLASINAIYSRLKNLSTIKIIGVMSHFAQADLLNSEFTLQQMKAFDEVTPVFSLARSLANSAGILAWPASHHEWVRPGLMLYGASPFLHHLGSDYHLKPVMTLRSAIIATSLLRPGDQVGYGGTWIAPEKTLIGIVAAGYGDGYPQFAQNGTPVLVNNQRCPLVGRVSMDMLTVDLRNQQQVQVGDPVILWGQGLPVENLAHHNHTSSYEIFTRVTSRPNIKVIN